MPMQYAAESVGIAERTLYYWIESAQQDGAEPHFLQFLQDVTTARSKALHYRLTRLRKHGKDNPKVDQWWCERMFPDEFGADKKLVKELWEQLNQTKAELEALRAVARRPAKAQRKRKKKRGGTVRGDGEGV